jgi:hypothetical protein
MNVQVKVVPDGAEKERILKQMQTKGFAPITLDQLEALFAKHLIPSTEISVCNLLPKSESSMPVDTTK